MRKRNLGVGEVSTSDSIPQRRFLAPFGPLLSKRLDPPLHSLLSQQGCGDGPWWYEPEDGLPAAGRQQKPAARLAQACQTGTSASLPQRIGVYKSTLACFVCLTAGVGPTSGQCSLAAEKMSAYRRLPTTCRRRHAAAEMPTAPRLLPTSSRFECRLAEVGPTSGQRRHAAAEIPTSSRCLPTSGRPRHVYWDGIRLR